MPDMTGPDPSDPVAETGGGDPSGRLTVGTRVVVRQLLADTRGAGATDVIGRLTDRTDDVLVIETKRGPVTLDN